MEQKIASSERIGGDPKYEDYVREKRRKGEKALGRAEWEAKVLGKGKEDEYEKFRKIPANKALNIMQQKPGGLSSNEAVNARSILDYWLRQKGVDKSVDDATIGDLAEALEWSEKEGHKSKKSIRKIRNTIDEGYDRGWIK